MNNYKTVRLSDVCDIVSGSTPKTNNPEYWEGSLRWITPAELNDEQMMITETSRHISTKAVEDTHLKLLPEGTVLFSSRAPIGKVAIAGNPMYCNQGFKSLICKPQINNKYLFYYLKNNSDVIKSMGRGATFKEVSKSQMENLTINLPSVPTQERIVKQLIKIDELAQMYKSQISYLDLMIRSRFIETFGLPGTDPKCLGLESLDNLCIINPKKNADARLEDENLNISFIPMSSVSEDGTITNVETKTVRELKKGFTYFADNDVLFAKITPCMENGKGAIARDLENGIGFGSTEFHVLRPKDNCNAIWLYTLLSFPEFRTEATNHMTGSAGQRRVPAKYLASYRTVIPPISEQKLFAQFVENAEKSKLATQKSIDELESLKKSLMQEYFG